MPSTGLLEWVLSMGSERDKEDSRYSKERIKHRTGFKRVPAQEVSRDGVNRGMVVALLLSEKVRK